VRGEPLGLGRHGVGRGTAGPGRPQAAASRLRLPGEPSDSPAEAPPSGTRRQWQRQGAVRYLAVSGRCAAPGRGMDCGRPWFPVHPRSPRALLCLVWAALLLTAARASAGHASAARRPPYLPLSGLADRVGRARLSRQLQPLGPGRHPRLRHAARAASALVKCYAAGTPHAALGSI
jgi:hypothetical protein